MPPVYIELFHGDCLDFMRKAVDKFAFATITDPPYGIERDKGFNGAGGFGGGFDGDPKIPRRQYDGDWDNKRPDKIYFDELTRCAQRSLVFGGNFFSDLLPVGRHWIVWDKMNTMPSFGDAELIWTNIPRNSVKIIRCEWNGLIGKEESRIHPTQKPLKLMKKLIELYTKPGDVIFDPYMGSGTTGEAAVLLGRPFIGCEKDKEFFAYAKQRIEFARLNIRLFA